MLFGAFISASSSLHHQDKCRVGGLPFPTIFASSTVDFPSSSQISSITICCQAYVLRFARIFSLMKVSYSYYFPSVTCSVGRCNHYTQTATATDLFFEFVDIFTYTNSHGINSCHEHTIANRSEATDSVTDPFIPDGLGSVFKAPDGLLDTVTSKKPYILAGVVTASPSASTGNIAYKSGSTMLAKVSFVEPQGEGTVNTKTHYDSKNLRLNHDSINHSRCDIESFRRKNFRSTFRRK